MVSGSGDSQGWWYFFMIKVNTTQLTWEIGTCGRVTLIDYSQTQWAIGNLLWSHWIMDWYHTIHVILPWYLIRSWCPSIAHLILKVELWILHQFKHQSSNSRHYFTSTPMWIIHEAIFQCLSTVCLWWHQHHCLDDITKCRDRSVEGHLLTGVKSKLSSPLVSFVVRYKAETISTYNSLFTLRIHRSILRINGERSFLRVNRL